MDHTIPMLSQQEPFSEENKTGVFAPLVSIFWARPPKIASQQKILIAIQEMEEAGKSEDMFQGALRQGEVCSKLATEILFVREDGNKFRPAKIEEVAGDEFGLTPGECLSAFYRLIGAEAKAPEQPEASEQPKEDTVPTAPE